MSSETASSTHHSEPTLLSSAGGLIGSALSYLKAHKDLLALEGRTAGVHYGIIAGLFAAAAVLIFFGYLFLAVTLVFGVASLFSDSHAWIWAMGIAGLMHVIGAVAAALVAKSKLKAGVFASTIEEFKKDSQWLHHLPKNP